jgi:hypothetical protein
VNNRTNICHELRVPCPCSEVHWRQGREASAFPKERRAGSTKTALNHVLPGRGSKASRCQGLSPLPCAAISPVPIGKRSRGPDPMHQLWATAKAQKTHSTASSLDPLTLSLTSAQHGPNTHRAAYARPSHHHPEPTVTWPTRVLQPWPPSPSRLCLIDAETKPKNKYWQQLWQVHLGNGWKAASSERKYNSKEKPAGHWNPRNTKQTCFQVLSEAWLKLLDH